MTERTDDALGRLLRDSRVSGSIFSRAELRGPWGIHTRGASHALFHVVVEGSGLVECDNAESPFGPGDVLLFPRGHAHALRDAHGRSTSWIGGLPRVAGPVPTLVVGATGPRTALLCGSFRLGPPLDRVLAAALPALVRVRLDDTSSWLDGTGRWLARELDEAQPGSSIVVDRLLEVLLVKVLRAWAGGLPGGAAAPLFDPQLSRGLADVVADPGRAASFAAMARRAGLSRTAFFERFQEVAGESPGQWVTRYRLALGLRALQEGSAVAEAAGRAGYASHEGFTRAFRRVFGVPPVEWRRVA